LSDISAKVNGLADFVTISQLTTALGIDPGKSNAGLEGQIRAFMHHEGWERAKKQINGARAWGYARPAQWPPIESGGDDAPAAPIGQQATNVGPSSDSQPTSPASKFIQEADDAPF
jgi:putative DNA primase/helicase